MELAQAGFPEPVRNDALLVLSELVGNAVLHGRPLPDGAIRVAWQPHSHSVEIAITDGGGATRPAPRPAGPMATSGRGLGIISELADRWGVTQQDGCSTVWAVVGHE
jgi:anti-sigma regulatory factor (Ser/Thr protein kinase)